MPKKKKKLRRPNNHIYGEWKPQNVAKLAHFANNGFVRPRGGGEGGGGGGGWVLLERDGGGEGGGGGWQSQRVTR